MRLTSVYIVDEGDPCCAVREFLRQFRALQSRRHNLRVAEALWLSHHLNETEERVILKVNVVHQPVIYLGLEAFCISGELG